MSSFYSNSSYDISAEVALDVDRLADAQRRKESYEKVIEYLVKQDLASTFVDDLSRLSLSEIDLSSNPLFIMDQSPFSEEPLELTHLDEFMDADIPTSRANDSLTLTRALYQMKLEASCLSAGPFYALRPVTTSEWDVTSEVPAEATIPTMTPCPCPSSPHSNDLLLAPQPTRPHCQPSAVCLLVEPPQSPESPVPSAETEQAQNIEEESAGDGSQSADRRHSEEQDPEASTWCSGVQDNEEYLMSIADADSENDETPDDDEMQFIDCDLNKSGAEKSKKRKPSVEKVSCSYPECKYSTKRPHDLKRHIRSIHTGEKKYVCQWPGCQAGFVRSEPYKIHYFSHAGVRPPRSVRKRKGQSKTKKAYRKNKNIPYKL